MCESETAYQKYMDKPSHRAAEICMMYLSEVSVHVYNSFVKKRLNLRTLKALNSSAGCAKHETMQGCQDFRKWLLERKDELPKLKHFAPYYSKEKGFKQ
jgi:hypothetical protein